jgi:hypothetical protein
MRVLLASTALALASGATGLSAQTTAFALFAPVQPEKKQLVFDNDEKSRHSIAATFDTADISAGVDVDFEFNSNIDFTGVLAPLNGPLKADFIMQSTTDDKAVRGQNGLSLQPIDSGTMEFRLETPVDGKDLLLEVAFSDVLLFTSHSSGLELAVGKPLSDSKITYSSDFLDFNILSPDAWAIVLSGIDSSSSVAGDGALNDFRASGSGVFLGAATPSSSIPEPETYGLIAASISLAAALRRKQWTKLFSSWKLSR